MNMECRPNARGLLTCQRTTCENDAVCDCGGCYGGHCAPPLDQGYCELAVP